MVQVRKDDVLRGRVVPVLLRRRLVMPLQVPVVRVERKDGRQVEVVAAARRADRARPRRTVARADVQRVELRVVSHRVPHRAAATTEPPFAGPRLGGSLHLGAFEAVFRVARNRVETPGQLAGVGVVSGKVTAHAILGAAIADQHLALHDARRARDRVRLGAVDGVHFPALLARARVERHQATIERADVDGAFPHRHAAIHGVATGIATPRTGHLGVEGPERLAGLGVECVHHAPDAGRVHPAIDDDRRRLQPARRPCCIGPGEPELAHVARVDLVERAVTLLVVSAPVCEPVLRLAVGGDDAFCRDGLRECRGERQQGGRQQDQQAGVTMRAVHGFHDCSGTKVLGSGQFPRHGR